MNVKDNGEGFQSIATGPSGNGLRGMQERLEFINGSLDINNADGTELVVHVPATITHQKGRVKE